MRAEQVSPLRLGRCGTWAAGLALHGGRDAVGPLASKAAIDVTAGHLPVGIAVGRALHPYDIGVPWVGGKNLTPGAFARSPRPLDTDPLHCLSSPRPVVAAPSRRRACSSLGPVLRGRYENAPGIGVTRRCPRGWNLPRPAKVPKSASMVNGLPLSRVSQQAHGNGARRDVPLNTRWPGRRTKTGLLSMSVAGGGLARASGRGGCLPTGRPSSSRARGAQAVPRSRRRSQNGGSGTSR
jgi:hypothetical protein